MKKYLYTICKRYLFLAFILIIMFTSCKKDVLTEVPLDFLSPTNAYTSLTGFNQGITGLYVNVRNRYNGSNYDIFLNSHGWGTDFGYYGEIPTYWNYTSYIFPASPNVLFYWTTNYQLIQYANVLIDKINTSNASIWTSDAQKQAYLAEARFFRAYGYRSLVSYFGDVPLVTDVVSTAKTDFVRAPKADIYKLMEDDLIFGAANLPVPGTEAAPGRVTQGAALHMLCETYLSESKFQQAVDAASNVINGNKYKLMTSRFGTRLGKDIFGSGDVYFDLFGYGNENLPENTESIWTIQFQPIITGGGSWPGERAFGCAYFRMGNTPDGFKAIRGQFVNGVYTGYSDTLGRPVSSIRPTSYVAYKIWNSDWKNDIRNAEHSIKRHFYYDSPGSAYDKKLIDWSKYPVGNLRDRQKDTCQYIFPFFMKAADPCNHFDNPAASGNGFNNKDLYAIRLAETILLRAEAYIGLNDKVSAAADINLIRNRANAKPVLAADVNIDYLLDERARELYTEENRLIVLRRTGKLVERVRLYSDAPGNQGAGIQDFNVLWPIPQSVIDLNVGAVMTQNPGY